MAGRKKAGPRDDLARELKEARAQQAATAEILRVMRASPNDLKPVFDAVVKNAARLCGARDASIFRVEGTLMRRLATYGRTLTALRIGDARPLTRGTVSGRAILGRRTVHVLDVRTKLDSDYPDLRSTVRRDRVRTIVAVPLRQEGKVLGAITVFRREVEPFTPGQIALLETFADQAVIAIENVRRFHETKESLERQTATAEILKVIASSPSSVQPVFESLAERATRLIDSPNVTVLVRDGDMLRALASFSRVADKVPDRRHSFPIRKTYVSGRALLQQRTVHEEDVLPLLKTKYPDARDNQRQFGFRTVLAVPMLRKGEAIGVLYAWRRDVRKFTPAQVALLETFADQAVIAIENARLFNETSDALERQTATAEILKVIASSPSDVQPVFDAIAKSALRLIGGVSATVTRLVGDTLHLAALTTTSKSGDEAVRRMFPVPVSPSGGTMGRVAQTKAPVYVTDTETDRVYGPAYRKMARARGFRSTVGVPMLREGKVIGTIVVTRKDAGSFSPHQIGLLQTFADQAVIAIENARLFNETKEALEQQTAISEVLRAISASPTDVKPVLEAVATRAARICDAGDARIFLLEGGQFRHAAGFGDTPVVVETFPFNRDSVSGRAALELAPIQIEDIEAESSEEYAVLREWARRAGWRTVLAVPLTREKLALGTITLRRREVRPFSEKQISLLRTFADQAAIAIENVRLFNETKEALERLYERYCARGEMENRIKEAQLGLFADRLSSHYFNLNQFRLLLASLAYVLVERLRTLALKGTEWASAQVATLRVKLLKIGAVILKNTRRIRVLLASGYPYRELFLHAARALFSP